MIGPLSGRCRFCDNRDYKKKTKCLFWAVVRLSPFQLLYPMAPCSIIQLNWNNTNYLFISASVKAPIVFLVNSHQQLRLGISLIPRLFQRPYSIKVFPVLSYKILHLCRDFVGFIVQIKVNLDGFCGHMKYPASLTATVFSTACVRGQFGADPSHPLAF